MNKDFDFNKYCNCYSMLGRINVECYDTILEANKKYETRTNDKKNLESRLIIMKKFWPEFMQGIIVQNEFRKPVVILPRIYYDNTTINPNKYDE